MTRTLILEVPENIYDTLQKKAEQLGHTPEELALELLETVDQVATDDPVEKFIGAIKSDVPDWVDQHDAYIARTLMEEMQNNNNID